MSLFSRKLQFAAFSIILLSIAGCSESKTGVYSGTVVVTEGGVTQQRPGTIEIKETAYNEFEGTLEISRPNVVTNVILVSEGSDYLAYTEWKRSQKKPTDSSDTPPAKSDASKPKGDEPVAPKNDEPKVEKAETEKPEAEKAEAEKAEKTDADPETAPTETDEPPVKVSGPVELGSNSLSGSLCASSSAATRSRASSATVDTSAQQICINLKDFRKMEDGKSQDSSRAL